MDDLVRQTPSGKWPLAKFYIKHSLEPMHGIDLVRIGGGTNASGDKRIMMTKQEGDAIQDEDDANTNTNNDDTDGNKSNASNEECEEKDDRYDDNDEDYGNAANQNNEEDGNANDEQTSVRKSSRIPKQEKKTNRTYITPLVAFLAVLLILRIPIPKNSSHVQLWYFHVRVTSRISLRFAIHI